MRAAIHRLARNPYLNLLAGLVLLGTSGWEVFETLDEPSVGAHHGVLVFAIIQLVKIFPELFEGVKSVHKGLEED
jgi:hypothetical protein